MADYTQKEIEQLKTELAEAKKKIRSWDNTKLNYCKEHRTIHCSCQQKQIEQLQAENEQLRALLARSVPFLDLVFGLRSDIEEALRKQPQDG